MVVETNQVPPTYVDAREVVDGGLGIVDVVVDHEGSPLVLLLRSPSDLSDGAELPEYVVEFLCCDLVGEVLDEDESVDFRREPPHVGSALHD